MGLTRDEKKALRELQKSIVEMDRLYSSINAAEDYVGKMKAGSAYRKLVNAQNQLQQEALDRDIFFKSGELKEIETIGCDIKKAISIEKKVKAALRLAVKVASKSILLKSRYVPPEVGSWMT